MTAASKAEVEKYNKNPHCNISRAPNDPFLQIAQWFEAKNYTAAKKIFFRCNKAEFHFHDFYWHTSTIHDVLYAPVFPANFLLVKYQFCSIKCCYAMVHHSWMHFLFVLQLLASRLRCCGRRPNDGQVLSTRGENYCRDHVLCYQQPTMASEGAKTNFLPTFTVFDNTKKVSFEQKQLKIP